MGTAWPTLPRTAISPPRRASSRRRARTARSRVRATLAHFAAVAAGGALLAASAPALAGLAEGPGRAGLRFDAATRWPSPTSMTARLGQAALQMTWAGAAARAARCWRWRLAGGRDQRRLELDPEAAGAQVRQAQPARRPGPHVLQAPARRHAARPACWRWCWAASARSTCAPLPALCRRAGAAAAGGAGAGRRPRCWAAWCCCCWRWRCSR